MTWLREEGSVITKDQAKAKLVVAKVEGPVRKLLLGERTALNLMARASESLAGHEKSRRS